MTCYRPLHGYRSIEKTENGKRRIVFNPKYGYLDMRVTVPCGQCIGCRLEKSRQWAIRCVYEAQLYEANCFITLTYDEDHLPEDHSLHLEDFQKFIKRLRKKHKGITPVWNEKKNRNDYPIRFFHCGEYGDKMSRPHFHACIFNFNFKDREIWKKTDEGDLYVSEELNNIWSKGYCIIGDVTFSSAAYVARYITKKINNNEDHYTRVNFIDGEVIPVKPEHATMSRRPGIGSKWFEKYKSDVYPHDFSIINGVKMKPPKYFDKLLEDLDSEEYDRIKLARLDVSDKFLENNTDERLKEREKFKQLQVKTCLQRRFEK